MQKRYFNHASKALLSLSATLLLILSSVAHAETKQTIVQSPNVQVFNKLWNQYCMDLGERTLQNYFLTDDEIKKMSGGHSDWIPNQALRTGKIFLVSDNYSALGTKCYRNYNLHRVIIKKSSPYPVVITPSEIDKLPASYVVYKFIYDSYKEFLTSDINNKIYSTRYSDRMEGQLPDNQRGVYFLFFNDSQKHKIAFKFDGLHNIYLYQLSRISKNTYNSKLIDKKGRFPDNISLSGPLQYKFTPKGLNCQVPLDHKRSF